MRGRTYLSTLWLALLMVLGHGTVAAAQIQTTGSILVSVFDEQKAVLPGVTVTISGPALISPMVGVTDGEGSYRAPALPPGQYTVRCELTGFKTLEYQDVVVSVGQTTSLDGTLGVASVQETITVRGAAPVVDRTNNNVSTTVDLGILQNTPGGRDIWSLLEYKASGLTSDRADVGGSESGLQAGFVAHGTPHAQNTQSLNGVNVSDPVSTGFADFYYDFDSFQEVQVSTGAHGVEVGTPGVYVNMVTKTGTDQWRGGVNFFYQNDKTQSDNIDQELRDKGIEKAGFDYLSDFTAQVGGPIVRNKLRFFAGYRDWRVHRFVTGFEDENGVPVVEPTDMYSLLGNGTYQANTNHRITGFYTRQEYNKPQRGASALNTPLSNWNEDDVFEIYQGLWNGVLSKTMFIESRVSYVDVFFPLYIKDEAKAAGNQAVTDLSTGKVTGANTFEFISLRRRLQANAVVSWYRDRWLGARHEVKFGWDFSNSPNEFTGSALDDVNLNVDQGFPVFVIRYNTPVRAEETVRTNSLFIGDTIQSRRLTVNLGVRFERAQGIIPSQSSPAGSYAPARTFESLGTVIDWKTFSPRGGIVYQLTSDGKTLLKASAARYFHQMSTAIPGAANPNGLAGEGVLWDDASGDLKFQPEEAGPVIFSFGGLQTSIDPDLKAPYTDEFLLGVDRELIADFRLSGVLSFRRERRQVGILDVTSTWIPAEVEDSETGQPITVFDKAVESIGNERFEVINSDRLDQSFRGFELIAHKRFSRGWQLLGSYSVSRANQEQVVTPGGDIYAIGPIAVDPNNGVNAKGPVFWDRTHVLKVSATYQLPWAILASGNLRSQSGPVFTRTLSVDLTQGPVTVFAEPREDSDRLDTLTTVDLRASKTFRLAGMRQFEVLVDIYNLFNANTVLDANPLTGPAFGDPLTVLAPRIARFGARFSF